MTIRDFRDPSLPGISLILVLIVGFLTGPALSPASAQDAASGEEQCLVGRLNTWVEYDLPDVSGFWFQDYEDLCLDEPYILPAQNSLTCFSDTPGTLFQHDGSWYIGVISDDVCKSTLEETLAAVLLADSPQEPPTVDELFASPRLHNGHSIVLRLYWAVLDRKPELGGALFWLDAYDSGDWDIRRIAAHFVVSEEFQLRYGDLSNADFTRLIYRNVLDRDPDQQGFDFWAGRLDAGMSRSEMVLLISNDAEFISNHPLPSDGRTDTGPANG